MQEATRRAFLSLGPALGFEAAAGRMVRPAFADPASERPKEGDVLVSADAVDPVALGVKDIPLGAPPLRAWPMEPTTGTVRSGSRLNKVLLVRLDPSLLAADTKERAADGIVAYSAFCPHAGCDVTGWLADQKLIECVCHASHYDPRNAAAVVAGPATRPLPALPLKLAGDKLIVARPFNSRVGIVPG
jgi:rieske iron-sulfur protein